MEISYEETKNSLRLQMIFILPLRSSLVAYKGRFGGVGGGVENCTCCYFSQRFLSKTLWFIKALSFGFENFALKFTAGFSQIFDHSNKISSWVIPEGKLGSMSINNREIKLSRWRALKGVGCHGTHPLLAMRSPSKAVRGRRGCNRNIGFLWTLG